MPYVPQVWDTWATEISKYDSPSGDVSSSPLIVKEMENKYTLKTGG